MEQGTNTLTITDDGQNDGKCGTVKKAGLFSATMLLAGSIIGTGIFMSPNSIIRVMPSLFYSLMIWLVCGIVSFIASLCYAELGCAFPGSGGEYTYFKHAYGNFPAFSFMYTNLLFIKPVCVSILVLFFAESMVLLIFNTPPAQMFWTCRGIAVVCTIIVAILNCGSNTVTYWVNNVITIAKFVCMLMFVGMMFYKIGRGEFEHLRDSGFSIPVSAESVSYAMYNGMWAYDGFNQLGYIVAEMKKPEKNLLIAYSLGMGIIIAAYMILNFSYLVIAGVAVISNSNNVALTVSYIYMQKYSAIVMALVAVSAFGAGNATAFCGGRIYFDAAKDGNLIRIFATRHKKQKTLIPALLLQALLSIIFLLAAKDIDLLLVYFTGAAWIFYTAAFIAVPVLRYRCPNVTRPYKVPIVFAVLVSIIGTGLVVMGFIQDWKASVTSVALVVSSLPVYIACVSRYRIVPKALDKYLDETTERLISSCSLEDASEEF